MSPAPEIRTARVLMRRWHEADREPFSALNADPRVMEYFPAVLTRAQSDRLMARSRLASIDTGTGCGRSSWNETGEFVGFTGIALVSIEAHFAPAVEVAWRLARFAWGHGYATEAGRAALAFGFEQAGLGEIVAYTSASNLRSRAVMERLGMNHDASEDFDHPTLEQGHRLQRHVLHRMALADWAR